MRIAVLGAGRMGAALARIWADADTDVCITTSCDATRMDALRRIDRSGVTWAGSVEDAVQGASFVLECLPEDRDLKVSQLGRAQATCPDAYLMTNTSSLRVSEIAGSLKWPGRLVGAHFFNPPHMIRLVEIVQSDRTEPAALTAVEAEVRRVGQTPVRVRRDSPGFIVNRLQFALLREAVALVDEGVAAPEDVDRVVSAGLAPRWATAGPFTTVALGGPILFDRLAHTLYPVLSTEQEPRAALNRLTLSPTQLRELEERRVRLLEGLFRLLDDGEAAQ